MNNKSATIVLVIATISLCLSVCLSLASFWISTRPSVQTARNRDAGDVQYVMYVGTNDKDTNEPVFSPEEARMEAEIILVKYFGGYTMQDAYGGWAADNKLYREYTLVIYLSDTDENLVHAAADELISKFKQSSILIQANESSTEFYEGRE